MSKKFVVVIEKEKSGYYTALAVGFAGCRCRAKTFNGLIKTVRKEIMHYLKEDEYVYKADFVGVRIAESKHWRPKKFTVVMEKAGKDFIAIVPSIPGCYTQAGTVDDLIKYIKEAITLCLDTGAKPAKAGFVRQEHPKLIVAATQHRPTNSYDSQMGPPRSAIPVGDLHGRHKPEPAGVGHLVSQHC
ncbi:MAG: type II toxin-antitoxin system HicB family antitoxin [Candidatus Aenigmarchaeota archaeon]|nr:type II toxin-antitoxin system HicB family antitoxin [Candidatus Aenigmarchaeota archaeon]